MADELHTEKFAFFKIQSDRWEKFEYHIETSSVDFNSNKKSMSSSTCHVYIRVSENKSRLSKKLSAKLSTNNSTKQKLFEVDEELRSNNETPALLECNKVTAQIVELVCIFAVVNES